MGRSNNINYGFNKSAGRAFRQTARSLIKADSAELLRHTRAIVRLGAGSANRLMATFAVAAMGGLTARIGISVTPTSAATIWRSVSMLVA